MVIAAPSALVLKAFFEADALGAWWQVVHSVTTPRALGPYAVEWAPTEFRDDVLGRLARPERKDPCRARDWSVDRARTQRHGPTRQRSLAGTFRCA